MVGYLGILEVLKRLGIIAGERKKIWDGVKELKELMSEVLKAYIIYRFIRD